MYPHSRSRKIILISGLLILVTAANAQLLLEDSFDDLVLDPAWQISLQNISSWSGAEYNSSFRVDDIVEDHSGEWSRLILSRDLGCLEDFVINADFGWTSTTDFAMQGVWLGLLDPDSLYVASGGFSDAWIGYRGGLFASVESHSSWNTGYDAMPFSGTVQVQIVRENSQLDIYMNGVNRGSAIVLDEAASLNIVFQYFQYPNSTIEEIRVNSISVEAIVGGPYLSADYENELLNLGWSNCPSAGSRIYGSNDAYALWPDDWQLVHELPAGVDSWQLPVDEQMEFYRVTRILE
jgi:hypothetical protein